jgi:ABC-type polysaccharide/polyol phosphate export permease
MGELMWSGSLVGRVCLPKFAFAVRAIGTDLVTLTRALAPSLLIALILGASLHATILYLPIVVFLAALFTPGMALAISSAVVYFQDVLPT